MKVLILAGGQGDRLGSLTDDCPKALVPVGRKELIRYTLDLLDHPKIREVGIIVGYHSKTLIPFMKKNYPLVQIFETPHHDKGSILGMECAHEFLDDDFVLMNSDHIYPKKLFHSFLKQVRGLTVACDFDRSLTADDMKIKKDDQNRLQEIHKELSDFDGGYIGMTFCPKTKIPLHLQGSRKALKEKGPKACVEMALAILAKEEEIIHIVDLSGIGWLEVDNIRDLAQAEATLKQNPDFLK